MSEGAVSNGLSGSGGSVNEEQDKEGGEEDREEAGEESGEGSAEGSGEEDDGGEDGREDEDHCESTVLPGSTLPAPEVPVIEYGKCLLQEEESVMGGAGDLATLTGDPPGAPALTRMADGECLQLGDFSEVAPVAGGSDNLAERIRNSPDAPESTENERLLPRDGLGVGPAAGGAGNLAELIADVFEFPDSFPNGSLNCQPKRIMLLRPEDYGCGEDRKMVGENGEEGENARQGGGEVVQGDAEEWDTVLSHMQEVAAAAASVESDNVGLDTWILGDRVVLDGLTLQGVTVERA
ncbi:unnamed protein product [Closterium sp. Naga37s-1]|nr:unnamed protein product [Closterium sp. Naga37s-1]